MKIILEGKAFELKFGFKCFINLGRKLGKNTFAETIEHFTQFENIEGDLTFDQLELIEELVIAAAEAHPQHYTLDYNIMEVAIIDELLAQPGILTEIFKAFAESFPTDNSDIKKNRKKTPAKKK